MARKTREKIKVKGFIRMQLVDDKTGKIVGDSGWNQNTITANGFEDYIVGPMGAIAGSKTVTHLALGTQTDAPTSTQTSLSGEGAWAARKAPTKTFVANGTLRCTANWATNEATASNIGAIGAYNTSSGGTIANAITVATSAKTTDQQLNATVEFRFS